MNNLCTAPYLALYLHSKALLTVVGLYIEQICLACLFFLKVSSAKGAAIIEAVFMIVLIALTASAHAFIHNSFSRESSFHPITSRQR